MGWAVGFGSLLVVGCPDCMLCIYNPSARVTKLGSSLGLTGQSVHPIGEIQANERLCLKGGRHLRMNVFDPCPATFTSKKRKKSLCTVSAILLERKIRKQVSKSSRNEATN